MFSFFLLDVLDIVREPRQLVQLCLGEKQQKSVWTDAEVGSGRLKAWRKSTEEFSDLVKKLQ